jgi:hypothetical protein
MARGGHAVDLRVPHAPGQVREAPRQFAVDEVAHPPGPQAQGHQRRDEVHRRKPAQALQPAEDRDGDEHAQETAVEAHAPFPHPQYLERVVEVVHRLVEEHVAQAPAQDHPEHAVEQHVVHALLRDAAGGRAARAILAQHDEGHEGEHVHEPVPAHGHGAEAQQDGIELRVGQHGVSKP